MWAFVALWVMDAASATIWSSFCTTHSTTNDVCATSHSHAPVEHFAHLRTLALSSRITPLSTPSRRKRPLLRSSLSIVSRHSGAHGMGFTTGTRVLMLTQSLISDVLLLLATGSSAVQTGTGQSPQSPRTLLALPMMTAAHVAWVVRWHMVPRRYFSILKCTKHSSALLEVVVKDLVGSTVPSHMARLRGSQVRSPIMIRSALRAPLL